MAAIWQCAMRVRIRVSGGMCHVFTRNEIRGRAMSKVKMRPQSISLRDLVPVAGTRRENANTD